jgi:transcriptional regulator with XRE-family HTH domain
MQKKHGNPAQAMTQDCADPAGLRCVLGRELKAARVTAGYSQAQLARITGYARSTISTVESGGQNVPLPFWTRSDSALGARGALIAGYHRLTEARREARAAGTSGTLNGVLADLAAITYQVPVPADRIEAVARMLDQLSAELADAALMLRSAG